MTLFYESDIAAIGGKIELERKLKSRIGYDLYIVTIKLGNIEAPALMKVYHKGQGKIIDLLKKSDEPASEEQSQKIISLYKRSKEINTGDVNQIIKQRENIAAKGLILICAAIILALLSMERFTSVHDVSDLIVTLVCALAAAFTAKLTDSMMRC